MSSIDDIWASMNDDYAKGLPAKVSATSTAKKVPSSSAPGSKQKKTTKSKEGASELTLNSIITGVDAATLTDNGAKLETLAQEAVKKTTKKKVDAVPSLIHSLGLDVSQPTSTKGKEKEKKKLVSEEKPDEPMQSMAVLSYSEFMTKISRDIQALSDSDVTTRKRALQHLHKALTMEYKLEVEREYNTVFHDICKPLFKRYSDPVEKCRELAHQITKYFFQRCQDFVPVLGYYFPALVQRLPKDIGFDEDMKIFVLDKEAHLAFKRGKAVDRQDKMYSPEICHVPFIENSEEIRFASIQALNALLIRVQELDCQPIMHAYFEDTLSILQIHIHDSNPEMKVLVIEALDSMAKISDYELGFKYYGVGLIRALLPQLKHRQLKVRSAAIAAIHHIMIVPDRAKRKASGSDAIMDLVGFREDNVLPIAAFYKAEVTFNYLAELVSDKSTVVRETLVSFLTALLTEIDDRYDHQQRLLPYILDLLTDEIPSIAQSALNCLKICGKQYEEEHFEEILQKKQYNVDGNDKINLEKPFPPPFTESGRPSIGVRLYVRGNSKRFLQALVNELTNWVAHTRLKSANLMKMIIILCEEHLTMEIHSLLPSLIKALRFARDDQDTELQQLLLEAYELLGRYLLPEIYLYYILPRLRGDPDVVAFGMDNETRITVMVFLQALLSGSKSSQIIPHFDSLVNTLTDSFLLNYVDSPKLSMAIVDIMETMCSTTIKGKSQHLIESFYVTTGRLSSLQVTIRKLFKFLLTVSSLYPEALQEKAMKVMRILSTVESHSTNPTSRESMMLMVQNDLYRLFHHQSGYIYQDILNADYDVDAFHTMNIMGTTATAVSSSSGAAGLTSVAAVGSMATVNNNGVYSVSVNVMEPTITEHHILQRLLTTPWYNIQSQPAFVNQFCENFLPKVLLQDIQCLQGIMDCEYNLFFAMAQLFLTMALPVYEARYTIPQRHYAEFFYLLDQPNSGNVKSLSQNRILPGMLIQCKDRVPSAVNAVNANIDRILDLLVYNHRWGKSLILSIQRLHVVALLSGQYNLLQQILGKNEDIREERYEEGFEMLYPLQNISVLAKHFSRLVHSIVPSALSPATPQHIRMAAVSLFQGFINNIKDSISFDKLRPFHFWSKTENNARFTESLPIIVAIQPLLQSLLGALNDSDDEVRIKIIETINDSAPFILSNSVAKSLQEGPEGKQFSGVDQVVLFPNAVQTLIRELLIEVQLTTLSPVVDHLDVTLRALCVLDPITFEAVVREEYLASGGNAGNEKKGDFVNDLINHADLISSMQSSML